MSDLISFDLREVGSDLTIEIKMIDFNTYKAQIETAIDNNDHIVASSISARLLLLFPGSAEAHYLNARTKAESGSKVGERDALVSAERAVALDPHNYRYNYYCGSLYREFYLYELALPLLRRSVEQEPNAAQSQLELADCYFDIDKGELAIPHYRAALKLEASSDRCDMIRVKLSQCLLTSGRTPEANLLINRLLKDGGPYYTSALSQAVTLGKDKPDSPIGKRVTEALLKQPGSSDNLEKLELAMGRLFENAGDYDQAFQHWIKSREFAKSNDFYIRDHSEETRKSKTFYSSVLFERTAALADQTQVPMFVAGMPRSGTTLTEQIISAHSQATGVGELTRWNKIEYHFMAGYEGENTIDRIVANAEMGQLKHLAKELLHIFYIVANEVKPRIVEKTPHNFASLGYFHLICPYARFIHIRRNPLDSFISTFQNQFSPSHGYAYDQLEYAKEYLWHEQMMDLWKSLFPELILTINYEQLVAEPEHVAKKIFEHIGLPWEEQTLRFFETVKTVRTFSTHQVRNPVNTASVDRWRRYEKHLGPLLKALGDAKFEYQYVPV